VLDDVAWRAQRQDSDGRLPKPRPRPVAQPGLAGERVRGAEDVRRSEADVVDVKWHDAVLRYTPVAEGRRITTSPSSVPTPIAYSPSDLPLNFMLRLSGFWPSHSCILTLVPPISTHATPIGCTRPGVLITGWPLGCAYRRFSQQHQVGLPDSHGSAAPGAYGASQNFASGPSG